MQPIAAAERELDRSNIHDALRLLSQCAAKLENVRIQSEIKDIETRYYYMLRFVMSNPKSNIAKETDSVKALLRQRRVATPSMARNSDFRKCGPKRTCRA